MKRRLNAPISVLLMALVLAGGWLIAPGSAHNSSNPKHNWRQHYGPLAKRLFYTKAISNARFIDVGEVASDADRLDGLDASAFASSSHVHSGADISGTVDESVIDVLIARVADVFDIVLAADGAGSDLDADLLDGMSSGAFAGSSHVHSGADVTSGTVESARIDALLARDAEVMGIVAAADGAGSGLDADLLDGMSSGAFAGSSHVHSGADITSGTVGESVIDVLIARVADVFDIVLAADGPGSGLDADLLDGMSSGAFEVDDLSMAARWAKESADALAGTATTERVVFVAPEAVTISDISVEPAGTVTANDTNFATIVVSRRDANGGSKATVVSGSTQTAGSGGTGNWTAFASVSLGTPSITSLAEGQKLTIELTKSGLGVVLPVLLVEIRYTVD